MYQALQRVPARRNTGSRAGGVLNAKGFAAPTRGWVTDENIAAQQPGSARVLDDCFAEESYIRLRSGSFVVSELDGQAVDSFLSYLGWPTKQLFASSGGNIYSTQPTIALENLTTQDPDENIEVLVSSELEPLQVNISRSSTLVYSGLTSGYFSYVNFSTPGGHFLVAANGTDPVLLYNGSEWSQITDESAPIAITGVDTSTLSHVSSYKNRMFYTQAGSLIVFYLPVGQIGGEVGTFSLDGVFRKGGSVLFTETWSVSVGDGMDDKFIVVSTEGEVAVYSGLNPGDANNWILEQRYEMPRPLGKNSYMRAEGDVVIATDVGLIRLTTIFQNDMATLSQFAVSRPIGSEWVREMEARIGVPIEVARWSERGMAIISLPSTPVTEIPICFVVNMKTGAWSRYRGWDTNTIVYHDGQVYFGTQDGRILLAEVGGNDDGQPYYPTMISNWDHLDAFGNKKTVKDARGQFSAVASGDVNLFVCADYNITIPAAPNAVGPNTLPSLWDVGQWDEARWDEGVAKFPYNTRWNSIGRSSELGVFAVGFITEVSGPYTPIQDFIEMTLRWETGGMVV